MGRPDFAFAKCYQTCPRPCHCCAECPSIRKDHQAISPVKVPKVCSSSLHQDRSFDSNCDFDCILWVGLSSAESRAWLQMILYVTSAHVLSFPLVTHHATSAGVCARLSVPSSVGDFSHAKPSHRNESWRRRSDSLSFLLLKGHVQKPISKGNTPGSCI